MIRRPPISTRTDTLFPYTTLFRSRHTGIAPQHSQSPADLGGTETMTEKPKSDPISFPEAKFPESWAKLARKELGDKPLDGRSEEHTSELQSLMRISYAVFCLKNKNRHRTIESEILQKTLKQK